MNEDQPDASIQLLLDEHLTKLFHLAATIISVFFAISPRQQNGQLSLLSLIEHRGCKVKHTHHREESSEVERRSHSHGTQRFVYVRSFLQHLQQVGCNALNLAPWQPSQAASGHLQTLMQLKCCVMLLVLD